MCADKSSFICGVILNEINPFLVDVTSYSRPNILSIAQSISIESVDRFFDSVFVNLFFKSVFIELSISKLPV